MDKKLLNDLKQNIYTIIKSYNANIIHSCKVFKNFNGRDIDALYEKENYSDKMFDNTIVKNMDNNSLRIYINHLKNKNFITLDIQNNSALSNIAYSVYKKNFGKKIYCKKTKLNHLDNKSIIFYKLIKYFGAGKVYSYNQLLNLKKNIKKLNKIDFFLIVNSIIEVLPKEKHIIKKFLYWKFERFSKDKNVKIFFLKKNKNKKRKIFFGELNYKKIIFSSKFIYSLILNTKAKWTSSHNPMPAISIIGNDGSGKTTIVEYIRKNFSKMDPLIINMKSSKPFFLAVYKIRKILKGIKKTTICKKISFINLTISFLGEIIDLSDKYFKYRIGMAWADSGYGLTIFERYPIDRVRGEFPNLKNKLIPFEQFFPFPDGLFYLDVLPKDSIKRKSMDNHTLEEMASKRKNYLSLLKEFDEVQISSQSKNIDRKIIDMKNYIFKIYIKKKKQIQKNQKIKRIKWNKNYNRVISGINLNRSKKEAYFD